MTKLLRSLIHERFSFDLRVELELLSRQRDISNKEKQQELIKTLRKYHIDDIVQLGSGTNRYAFKLSGFVVKFATDHDGKIDNLKEFKMAKRLYPHAIKVSEVSANGTMLVAEYIQPFDSFAEMCQYQDKIRKILSDMASTYLIGDVGISEKNYSNWGLRVGTKEPVCLDFAYVYEVSSTLFLCQYCRTNSMLVPNKDFSELYCSNNSCGRKYLFEDIRRKIGNDIHRHEIGDLGDEGYVLTESNTLTELTLNRSNYLQRKEDTAKKHYSEQLSLKPVPKGNFVMKEPIYHIKDVGGGNTMDGNSMKLMIKNIQERMETENSPEQNTKRKPGSGFVNTEPLTEESNIAYRCKGNYSKSSSEVVPLQKPVMSTVIASPSREVTFNKNTTKIYRTDSALPNISVLSKSISRVSNSIKDSLNKIAVFDKIGDCMRDKKMLPEKFYTNTQNCIYHSLREFVGLRKDDTGANLLPDVTESTKCLGTLIFFDRIFNNRQVSHVNDSLRVMTNYRNVFGDYDGIQSNWIELFISRMKEKLPSIDDNGIRQVADIIKSIWCSTEDIVVLKEEKKDIPVEEPCEIDDVQEEDTEDVEEDIEDEDDDDGSDENYEERCLDVTIVHDEYGFDIVTITSEALVNVSEDLWEKKSIVFYKNLSEIPVDKEVPSIADDRNGMWDWLIHFPPKMIFKTKDPDQYLECNYYDKITDIKCLVLENQDGICTIGIYYIDSKFGSASYDDPLIWKINYLVNTNIVASDSSHLIRSLKMTDLFKEEEYILRYVAVYAEHKETNTEPDLVQAAMESMPDVEVTSEPDDMESEEEATDGEYVIDDHQMDNTVVHIGNQYEDDNEDTFLFTPMRKGKKNMNKEEDLEMDLD